jgi:hypothetical protein
MTDFFVLFNLKLIHTQLSLAPTMRDRLSVASTERKKGEWASEYVQFIFFFPPVSKKKNFTEARKRETRITK